jgi:ubiquitin-conjugating enzyme E2 O
VDAAQRTATLLFNDTGKVEMVSLLELDPHGTSDNDLSLNYEGLGVRRGDFVFIHREGTTNGFEKPRVPRIGELEAWVREKPFVGGQLNGWRKEISELGTKIANSRVKEGSKEEHMQEPDENLHWVGEVVDVG